MTISETCRKREGKEKEERTEREGERGRRPANRPDDRRQTHPSSEGVAVEHRVQLRERVVERADENSGTTATWKTSAHRSGPCREQRRESHCQPPRGARSLADPTARSTTQTPPEWPGSSLQAARWPRHRQPSSEFRIRKHLPSATRVSEL